jgi:hypothetical protein
MIRAYRSDTIRGNHSVDYDNDRGAPGALADRVKCRECSAEYSFFFVANKHAPESLRAWAETLASHEHPQHAETFIRVPEGEKEAAELGL